MRKNAKFSVHLALVLLRTLQFAVSQCSKEFFYCVSILRIVLKRTAVKRNKNLQCYLIFYALSNATNRILLHYLVGAVGRVARHMQKKNRGEAHVFILRALRQ